MFWSDHGVIDTEADVSFDGSVKFLWVSLGGELEEASFKV